MIATSFKLKTRNHIHPKGALRLPKQTNVVLPKPERTSIPKESVSLGSLSLSPVLRREQQPLLQKGPSPALKTATSRTPSGPITQLEEPQSAAEEERRRLLELKTSDVDRIVDGLGLGLDSDIKKTIVALQLHNFSTTASCGGHAEERGLGNPWVDISSPDPRPLLFSDLPNAPNFRQQFQGQREVYESVAKSKGLELKDLVGRGTSMKHQDANQEAWDKSREGIETPEHQAWVMTNKTEQARFEQLLAEYHLSQAVPAAQRVSQEPLGSFGSFRIYSGSKTDLEKKWETPQEEASHPERLANSRQAMDRFADFLIGRYLKHGA